MSLLEELQTVIRPLDIPIETGVFTEEAPERYVVVVPLSDTFDLHADNSPGYDVQEARLSIYTRGSYPSEESRGKKPYAEAPHPPLHGENRMRPLREELRPADHRR